MHARHRSPGNGYRSSSVGMGGLAAGPRISAESSSRGRGMYNSQYRGYNRGFGRGQPKPSQPAAQPPVRRTDVFMEAGRLATEYLVSKGLLHPNVLSGKWQNGSLKNQLGDFQGFKQQEGDSLPLPPEGRTSALSRLGNAAADARGSGRRRFSPDEYNSTGSRSFMRGRRRMGTLKNYGSDWGRDMGRSGSWSEKTRASPDMEGGDDYFSAYQEEQLVSNDVGGGGQKPHLSELAPTSDSAGDSKSALEKFHIQDAVGTKASSSNAGKDLPAETEVELTKKSDDMELVKEETVELTCGTSGDQVEKQSDMKHVLLQHCAAEVDSINKNTADLLSLCRFTKVPTKTRSSLTTRGLKVDLVPLSEEEEDCETGRVKNDCDMGPPMGSEVPIRNVSGDSYSADASSKNQSETCPDSGVVMEAPVMSEENSGDLDPLYVEQGKCTRSQSFAERCFMNEQESSEGTPGFGRCSSMIMERGLKRASQHSDSRDRTKKPREWLPPLMTQRDDFLNLSNLRGNQPASQEGRRSPGEEVFSATDEEGPVDMSMFQRCDAGPSIEYAEEKQLFPASFKICDLNLMESSEVNEIPDPNSILRYPSIPESDKDTTPVDVDLSISNGSNMSGKYGADGREVEVIDLENDAVQEHKDFNNCERKAETVFSGLESLTNHAQSANDISDAQDGYGLMISELLGADISNCSSVPGDINSLHNEMAIHNGEGILGDDEAIYMSLGEIPISMPEI